jgi:hypothetical protein
MYVVYFRMIQSGKKRAAEKSVTIHFRYKNARETELALRNPNPRRSSGVRLHLFSEPAATSHLACLCPGSGCACGATTLATRKVERSKWENRPSNFPRNFQVDLCTHASRPVAGVGVPSADKGKAPPAAAWGHFFSAPLHSLSIFEAPGSLLQHTASRPLSFMTYTILAIIVMSVS